MTFFLFLLPCAQLHSQHDFLLIPFCTLLRRCIFITRTFSYLFLSLVLFNLLLLTYFSRTLTSLALSISCTHSFSNITLTRMQYISSSLPFPLFGLSSLLFMYCNRLFRCGTPSLGTEPSINLSIYLLYVLL
ncbi:hypothetical protein C8J55DRAFT_257642 [Lentinula edodes]|uniref:Uncharacterized protein n=1 Tax=Lentinula lateritia TaxID=40482 RepID=A0A9W8ZSI5_9AGAR|nr:hypothetical protein C8J55DRAFT_257642 [Lentinula edodes]